MMEKKKPVGITIIGWIEIVISIFMLLIWFPKMLIDFLSGYRLGGGFNAIYGVILCPIYTLTLLAGIFTLKLKPLGRKMNLVVWCIMIGFVLLRGLNMLMGSGAFTMNTLTYMSSLKVLLLYPHIFPFPITPNIPGVIVLLLLIYYFTLPKVKTHFNP